MPTEKFRPTLTVASPGRINLIGEHTDYNLGWVLPAAIDKKFTFRFRPNQTATQCRISSVNYNTQMECHLDAIARSNTEWENYILGVLNELLKRTDKLQGFDCEISGDLPAGSGLSSSAALECGLAYGLNHMFSLGLPPTELVTLCRDAEHTFVGTHCGIMDQFASLLGQKDLVILLDCKTMEPSFIPARLSPYKLLLLNTNVSHSLATSAYNIRRKECEMGVEAIQKHEPVVTSLRDLIPEQLAAYRQELPDKVYQRCQYVLEENSRVLNAAGALRKGDLDQLGTLMYASHEGLRQQYEVSCPELDFLVDFSLTHQGILGARLMGGGFGGCTLNLVHQDAIPAFVEEISAAYLQAFNRPLTPLEAIISNGARILD